MGDYQARFCERFGGATPPYLLDCALNVHRGYNLKISSLNDGQCCNKDERLSSGSYLGMETSQPRKDNVGGLTQFQDDGKDERMSSRQGENRLTCQTTTRCFAFKA